MSIDEGELRASLSTALDELDYRPLPLDSVVSQGKAVVLRRRLTVLAGALAVVVAAVAGPVTAHQAGPSVAPAGSPYPVVTVQPPGPGSPRGLIASGRLNHRHWQITGAIGGSAGGPAGQGQVCFKALADSCHVMAIPAARDKGGPVDFSVTVGDVPMPLIGDVRSDVRYVTVSLSNGQILTLRPVAIFGRSHAAWVALMVPYPAAITRITAYSANGEVGYAMPFGRGPLFSGARWLAPGQPRPGRHIYKIAFGKLNGLPWAEYAFIGPWGTCITGAGTGGQCFDEGLRAAASRQPAQALSSAIGWQNAAYDVLIAQPVVSYVIVHVPNQAALRLVPRSIGGVKFIGFAVTPADANVSWVAHSASGEVLAAGTLSHGSFGSS
jgi:hypothetical protein